MTYDSLLEAVKAINQSMDRAVMGYRAEKDGSEEEQRYLGMIYRYEGMLIGIRTASNCILGLEKTEEVLGLSDPDRELVTA